MNELLKSTNIFSENKGTSTGSEWLRGEGQLHSISPIDGQKIATVEITTNEAYESVLQKGAEAFKIWRTWPAPKRGEVIRQIGTALRENKKNLGALVAYEMGKSLQEGYGEIQEMIDICDYAVGLSRQLYGLTMHSERPGHRIYEQWHPIGIVGIISAFNFPAAVWSWNAIIAWVCGNVCLWKPSEKTPLVAVACQKLVAKVFADNGVPEGVSSLIIGDGKVGEWMSKDARIPLISATGSTRMGKNVAINVAARLGTSLLELGGNNAVVLSEKADLEVALPAIVFGAVGTAGQRCTSIRRLFIHESIFDKFTKKLVDAYHKLKIGDPLDENNHIGPLIDRGAVESYLDCIRQIKLQGGEFLMEGKVLEGDAYKSGCYVSPCIALVDHSISIVKQETFAPVLYVIKYTDLNDAIQMQNDVPQGLSSSIMTLDLREAELFLSAEGSDCGIANVNIGTSGAEIGGAFGGEKETGGGRESGSDAWKAYMRRQTNTINYSKALPLAQGIKFDF